jgi:glucose/arabinose dehydrogenase
MPRFAPIQSAAAVLSSSLLLAPGLPAPAAAQVTVPEGFSDRLVLGGLSAPVGMAWLPDGRMLIIEQKTARVRLLVNGVLAAVDPVGSIDQVRTTHGEQGLLGIAVDPGWPARPYIYVHCDDSSAPVIRVSRYTLTGDLAFTGDGSLTLNAGSRRDLINDIPDAAGNHNGGTLRFGPDGMLYGSFGDDAVDCAAQTPGLRGVILRMDVSRVPAGAGGPPPRAILVPPGNPFPAAPDSNALLVWAFGLRNPFRFSVDKADGALWIGDVGQDRREEINHQTAGGLNFGWPHYEGSLVFDAGCPASSPVFPVAEYGRTDGRSVIAAGIFRSPASPGVGAFPASYDGDGFFSDYYTGILRRMVRDGATWRLADPVPGQPTLQNWGSGFGFVSDWLFGPDGDLWYCRQGSGQIRRVSYDIAPDTTAAGVTSFARPFPIPAEGEVNLRYTLGRAARVSLRIYDARGALVRTLVADRDQGAATHDVLWRGVDEDEAPVPPGVYFARLTVDGRAETRTVPLIR